MRWQNRAHFCAIAAQMMRRIPVDYAPKRRYAKRGGADQLKVSLSEVAGMSRKRGADVAALDEALKGLAELDLQQSRVVELRFFGGLTIEETADALGLSHDVVKREWRRPKRLYREMSGSDQDDDR